VGPIRNFLSLLVIALWTAACGAAAILTSFFDKSGRAADAITRNWAGLVAALSGLKITVEGAEVVDRNRSYVLVANHRSHLDTIALVLTCPLPLRMLAKAELFNIPIFGQALARVGHLRVDRRQGRTDLTRLGPAVRKMVDAGRTLCVFAEGSRQPEGAYGEFKRGAFYLARQNGLPILPVSIVGTGAVLPPKRLRLRPGTARLRYHPPIEISEQNEDELRSQVFEIIRRGGRELERS